MEKMQSEYADSERNMTWAQAVFYRRYADFDRGVLASHFPGEALYAGTFLVGRTRRMGRVHLHLVVDAFKSLTFGSFCSYPGEILRYEVMPRYLEMKIPICQIFYSENIDEVKSNERYTLELVRESGAKVTQITRDKLKLRGEFANVMGLVREEFFPSIAQADDLVSMEGLQAAFSIWLERYNAGRWPRRHTSNAPSIA